MHRIPRPTCLVAAVLTLALGGCGDSGTDTADNGDDAFCSAMERVAALLAPDTGSSTPPQELRADFEEVVTQLDEAEQHAPAAISDDVAAFATAIDDYVVALAAADYDLDTIFSTPEGTRLAEDTSHALTPDVVNHLTGPCAITLD